MIVENLWPLLFIAAIPVVIILYLLKPKGVDQLISSNLLWKKFLKNEQSRTFFEKFVHNLLMYVQILVIILLMIALMAPFMKVDGRGGSRKVLLIDTSGSMQHLTGSGKTRLEAAVEQAADYVRTEDATRFSVVTTDESGTRLLAVDIADTEELLGILGKITATDCGGTLAAAQSILDTLAGAQEDSAASLVVYTDAAGASGFDELNGFAQKELYVLGEPCENVANEYTVFSEREDGTYDVVVSARNYSGQDVLLDVGLYDESDKLIALSQMSLEADEANACLFEQVEWQGAVLTSKLSGIAFAEGGKDALAGDNQSAAVKSRGNQIEGALVGRGNTFIEKAYLAVTGRDITKVDTDLLVDAETFNVAIYDGDKAPQSACNRLIFGDPRQEAADTLQNVVLHMKQCDLTNGLSDFTVGVNTAYCFTLPEGAKSFLEYDGKCVGYYGERDGQKEVVLGFDIRESDFPLRAEFPVFLANAMIYLSDTSWLSSNIYYAGEEIHLQPWADQDVMLFESVPVKAGVYQVGNERYQERYVVRFRTGTESEGRGEAASVTTTDGLQVQKVRKTLRNFFILLALLLLVVEWLLYVRQMRYRGFFYPAVRGIVVFCLFLALFGIGIRIGSNKTATVFVVDLSNSNAAHQDEMQEYLARTVGQMPKGNVYGIVTFGKGALVEQFMTNRKNYGQLMTIPEGTATNFEEAVSRALTMIPGNANGRLVVLTDGRQTRGDIQNMAQALVAGRTEFATLLYENEVKNDAYIDQVIMPVYLHPGDRYSVTVLTESNYDTDAVIAIYHGSVKSAEYSVHLNKGSNRFVFSDQVAEDAGGGSMESLRVQVQAAGDGCAENDFYNAYSVVEATPKVLVVSGRGINSSNFTSILQAAGCDYSVVSALNAPSTMEEMLAYRSILLVDTYIDDLPQGFLNNLESYVKDYGCGFVCCGGENSFALGGYRNTVLETVLPVNMQLKAVNEMQHMAMVMVIDRSGSMLSDTNGVSNLDVAIRAATVAVDNLQDEDYVGVLTFDTEYTWQVELTKAKDREKIKESIKAIREGGGTTIKPAVQEAYDVISACDAQAKHVVLLTDGMGETTDFKDVIKDYTSGGVTLSTVAVGSGSDTQLLKELATRCGGRYYYSDVSLDIPKIFAQEVFLGGDSYIQNGDFALSVRQGHELTSNLFPNGWPRLYGYVSATEKTAANPIIKEPEKDAPILTVWQYGLGRTVAWNSDVTGAWTAAFSGADDTVQLWKRIVDYSTGNASLGGDRVNVVTAGEQTTVVYQTEDYSGKTEVLAKVVDPEGADTEVRLHATAPGKYEAALDTAQAGLYHLNIRREEDGEIQSYLTTATAVQFSDEYKFDVSTAPYLNFVQRYGQIIDADTDVWGKVDAKAKEKHSLTNWLLALAILLFLADIAMRRFQYEPDFAKIAERGKQRRAQKAARRRAENAQMPGAMQVPGAGQGMAAGQGAGQMPAGAAQMPGAGQTMTGPGQGAMSAQRKDTDRRSRKAKPQEQILDTSQLLKKKDDRNI